MTDQMGEKNVATARVDGRAPDQLRAIRFANHIAPYATGSTLIEWGNTRVICGVTVEESVPRWMKEQNVTGGWITAEYSMLPYSTLQRKQRDISKGKIDGRSQEIQRLIGRAMRSALDLEKLGPRTIWVDCDVLQADGGTRTAAITGSFVALSLAVRQLRANGKLATDPIVNAVAAVSVGIIKHQALLDLNYTEDVAATVDMNIVMTSKGEFIELQGTGEESTFTDAQLTAMLAMGRKGIGDLISLQQSAINAPRFGLIMDNPTRLYLLRHGEVEARYHRVFGGKIDMELSPRGHEQVKALADYFQRHPPHVMYASPMKRVQQTLAPLAKWTGLTPIILPGLREVDFGAWTGLAWEQVYERFKVSAFDWLKELEAGSIADAESTADFRKRVDESLRQILKESPHKEVAVVAHGGVIRMLLALILDLPFARTSAFDIEYASITKVKIAPNKTEIELLNFSPWRDL